jgi:redox-regulated HSP33 family molecular chaperone
MLNRIQRERIEKKRGKKHIRWRVDRAKDEKERAGAFVLKMIDANDQKSMNRELERYVQDLQRLRDAEPQIIVGIYSSDVDIALIDEDIACYLEVGG